ncbi:hypothetical protein MBLNU457_g0771t1 [Dothideomycetes sp. NU457]
MKTTMTALLALATSTLALPHHDNKPYTLTATKTNSFGLLDKPLNASNGLLWVNMASHPFCPIPSTTPCPNSNLTSFVTGPADKFTDLNSVVDSQHLFISADGIVKFTDPSQTVPADATVKGVMEILTQGTRTWLCNLISGEEAYYAVVARNETAVPIQADGSNTCARATFVTQRIEKGATAYQYE